MTPLLTVAVPTHNRARYAIHAIRSLLAIPDTRLEIVVADTSTDGELLGFLKGDGNSMLSDPRLRYFQPNGPLDMTGNHNAAIHEARGEFVCLIGDDDAITSEALRAAAWAKQTGCQLIAPNVVTNYAWPDFRSRYLGMRHASRLYFSKNMGGAWFQNSSEAVDRALRNAAQGTDGLPKIYHGIVHRSVLEKLRERSGAYFHGSSPDVSGAIGLGLCSQRFLVVDYPLTIPGASGGSNTGRSAMNRHKGKLGQESQTKAFQARGWSAGVPRFFSEHTVWAHAAVETIARIAPNRVSAFNFARLIAVCRVLHVDYRSEIEHALADGAHIVGTDVSKFREEVSAEMKRFKRQRLLHLLNRLRRPTAAGGRHYVAGIKTIAEAPIAVSQYVAKGGLSWDAVVSRLT